MGDRFDKIAERLWDAFTDDWGAEETADIDAKIPVGLIANAMRTAVAEATLLRPEVLAFAHAMERKLRANDHKGGWQNESFTYLLRRLRREVDELSVLPPKEEWNNILDEAADVGNFAMMIADVCGVLRARGKGEP